MSIVRVAEIGYGTSSAVVAEIDGKPDIRTFSSVVVPIDKSKADLGSGLSNRNTIKVDVDGVAYEVGEDAHLVAGTDYERVLNNDYIRSPQYRALLSGCLYMMDTDEIDVLVLGVPVNAWSLRDKLKTVAEGTHTINERTINVKHVWVIPQPFGGLLSYANSIGQKGFNELADMTIACADGGYLTWDYTTSVGLKLNESRSGATNKGMSTVLENLASAVKETFNLPRISNELIDTAFWKTPGVLKISGVKYPFPVCNGEDVNGDKVTVNFDYSNIITDSCRAAVNPMRNTVGDGIDVDLIIAMGGPISTYLPALKEAYPNNKIIVLENHLQAICEGMFFGGKQYAKQLSAAGSKTKKVA